MQNEGTSGLRFHFLGQFCIVIGLYILSDLCRVSFPLLTFKADNVTTNSVFKNPLTSEPDIHPWLGIFIMLLIGTINKLSSAQSKLREAQFSQF